MKLTTVTAPFALALLLAPAGRAQDADAELLIQRRDRPVPAAASPDPTFGNTTPRVLFTRAGEDNANALLVHPDANGDGVPDVAVGWDIFQNGNDIELMSGGSLGGGSLVWGKVSQDGLSGGYYSDPDQLATFPDVSGDGVPEVLSATSGGGRAATLYDGATGAVLQSFDTYLGTDSGWVYQALPVPDVNGSGTDDFVVVTGSMADSVYMVEGSLTGVHHDAIWSFKALDALFAVDLLGDVDGDGVTDVVVAAGDNADRVYALSGATGEELWMRAVVGTPWELTAYPDQNGDGVNEVVTAVWSTTQSVQMIIGATGEVLWTSSVPGANGMDVVVIEDVTGDGRPEIAVSSWADRLFLLNGENGELVWQTPLTGGDVWAETRVDDVTGDGISEIAYGSFDGFAYLADGATGATLWSHFADGRKVLAIRSGPDLDGDGSPEVVAGAQQLASGSATLVWVLDADSTVPGSGPELRATGGTTLGTTATLELENAPVGDVVLWLFGGQTVLLPDFGYGSVAVSPGVLLQAFTSIVPAGGRVGLPLFLPNDPQLVGVTAHFQTLVLSPVFPFFGTASNRAGFVIGA